jgi:hypothetical protein
MLQLFVPLQELLTNVKRKELLKNVMFFLSVLLCLILKDSNKLNYIGFGILLGFFSSLSDILFGTLIVSKKKLNK